MKLDDKVIKKFIELIENARLKVRGGRGYSAGHPYQEKDFNTVRGKSEYEPEVEDNVEEILVKVSRAFDDDEEDDDE